MRQTRSYTDFLISQRIIRLDLSMHMRKSKLKTLRLHNDGSPLNAFHSHEALSRLRWIWSISAIVTHISLILLYTLVTLIVLTQGFHNDQQRFTVDKTDALYYCMLANEAHCIFPLFVSVLTKCTAPAREAMAVHGYTPPPPGLSNAPYAGNPSPELDQAWQHLLRGTMTDIPDSQPVVVCTTQCIARCILFLLVPY